MRLIAALVGSVVFPASALANTWVVDAAGGGDFTDLPQAVAAAAQADVLLVLPGNYSAFALDKRLLIVGQGPGVNVSGQVHVHDINTGSTTALVDLNVVSLKIESCSRPVILDGLKTSAPSTVNGCVDVRFARSSLVLGGVGDFEDALQVDNSRVEISDSVVHGRDGFDCFCCGAGSGGFGGAGVRVRLGSHASVYRSSLGGGVGGESLGACCDFLIGGDGGIGLQIQSGCTGLVAGLATDVVAGGADGDDCLGGSGGTAWSIMNSGSARRSGATVPPPISGTFELPALPDPSLTVSGTPVHGNVITFRVDAEPGANVDLIMGRNAIVTAVPGLAEDLLVLQQRVFHLGTVGASGHADFNFPVPASLPSGFTFFAQAKVSFSASDVRYSNSTPVIVR